MNLGSTATKFSKKKKYLQHQTKFSAKKRDNVAAASIDDGAAVFEDDADIYQQENFIILRLPVDVAEKVSSIFEGERMDMAAPKLSVSFTQPDLRRAVIRLDKRQLKAKLMDLPCIIEVVKTVDKKNFYKVADMSQMLMCDLETENKQQPDKKREKLYLHPHGITPPLKNVRKRRFRKTLKKKYVDAPELDKELKRLLRADLEAVHVRYEVVSEDQEKGEEGGSLAVGGEIEQTKTSALSKPPEFHFSVPQESEVFGGRVSSSSSEDGEGGAMARELLAGSSAAADSHIPDELKTDLVVSEAELAEITREKQDLEAKIKSLDNAALKEKFLNDIKRLNADEKVKREELLSLRRQSGLK